jgi:hypothetical protein
MPRPSRPPSLPPSRSTAASSSPESGAFRETAHAISRELGRAGQVLVAVNVIDDLEYRIHAYVGPVIFDNSPPGSFLVTRVVPVGDEWLISGQPLSLPAEQRDVILKIAADAATRHPELVFRNAERLARSWERQAADRAAFIDHFGVDIVILDVDGAAGRLMEYSAKTYSGARVDPMASILKSVPPWADTVGLIYDETDGLGVYFDLHLVEEAFADPELTRKGSTPRRSRTT